MNREPESEDAEDCNRLRGSCDVPILFAAKQDTQMHGDLYSAVVPNKLDK